MASEPKAARTSGRRLAWLRSRLRASEAWFIALSVLVGAAAGLLSVLQAGLAHLLQTHIFGFSPEDRLSALPRVAPLALLWLPVGGLLVGVIAWLVSRWPRRRLIDVVEANALYGGRVSFRDSLIVCGQTLLSNGFGASVGLEAAYAQAGGAAASLFGRRLNLRRADLRTLVGAGAGAAIGAAFGAPLTGAFYAFEIVLGSYTPSMIAPVAAACLSSALAAQSLGEAPYSLQVTIPQSPDAVAYLLYAVLGVVCALFGIALIRAVTTAEALTRRAPLPIWMRPMCGGALLAIIALGSPQVLSSGHGALHVDLATRLGLQGLLFILLLKSLASIVSLGFGFRGGLFFAALFLGSLLGQIYAEAVTLSGLPVVLRPEAAAMVGMGALGVAIVGGPLTMSFLVLEATRDFGLAGATLAAALISTTIVRSLFGYSFSTWRLHLRGETIRSARDVGWVRALTAGRLMRPSPETIADTATLAEFRRRFPIGAGGHVILLDEAQRYAGVAPVVAAYADGDDGAVSVDTLRINRDVALKPDMNIAQIMQLFDQTEADELAVIDEAGQPLGLVSELDVTRRYAREVDKAQQELFGER